MMKREKHNNANGSEPKAFSDNYPKSLLRQCEIQKKILEANSRHKYFFYFVLRVFVTVKNNKELLISCFVIA